MTHTTLARASPSSPTAPKLPAEMLGSIIRELVSSKNDENEDWSEDVSAFSLVSRAFGQECQRILFRSISLHPENFRLDGYRHLGTNTLSKFADLMATSPHLGAYIKELTITFPRDRQELANHYETALAYALGQVTALAKLTLRIEDERGAHQPFAFPEPYSEFFKFPSRSMDRDHHVLSEAILGLLKRPGITELKLRNIGVPQDAFSNCSSLDTLHLITATVYGPDKLTPIEHTKSTLNSPTFLKNLTLNKYTMPYFQSVLDMSEDSELPIKWAQLEALALPVTLPEWESESKTQRRLLSQLTCLRKLEMNALKRFFPFENEAFSHTASPLAHLNRLSFQTLTYLSFAPEFELQDSEDAIRDPYQGLLCDRLIRELTQLEVLNVTVWIGGRRSNSMDEDTTFGDQWAELDHVLVPPSQPRPLQKLHLIQLAVGYYSYDPDDDEDEQADLYAQVRERVYDVQFPSLKELHQQGAITLRLELA